MSEARLFGPAYHERIANAPARKPGDDRDECALCGRLTRSTWMVNLDNGPESYGSDMGWFPVGSECRRAVTAAGWEVKQANELG